MDEGDSLSYRVSKEDGSPLPDWLAFNSGNLTFQGIPESDDVSNLTVKVEAIDKAGGKASDVFALSVEAAPVDFDLKGMTFVNIWILIGPHSAGFHKNFGYFSS